MGGVLELFKNIELYLKTEYEDDYIVSIKNDMVCIKHVICGNEKCISEYNLNEIICGCMMDTETLREKIYRESDGEYYLFNEYVNPHTEITLIHNKCGGAFGTTANQYLSNQKKCPDCAISWGEKAVRDWLIENNIAHVKQYRFPDCKFKRTLPFDFYLPTFNTAIEYDGEQHFVEVDRFGGAQGLIYRQQCDRIKNKYCEKNKIRLIRISKENNINESLQVILDELNDRHNTYANDDEDFDAAINNI